jgi:hypothetical protein
MEGGLVSVSMLLPIHVAAGGLALVLGAMALSVKKGGTIHRRSGLLFVSAMVVMGISASILGNVGGGVRIMRFGVPRGGPRLARHLWRMCFALFIAAGSFFSIRERVAKILPQPFTTAPMRALPILLLFGAMFYWLWRVRGRRTLPVLVRHDV